MICSKSISSNLAAVGLAIVIPTSFSIFILPVQAADIIYTAPLRDDDRREIPDDIRQGTCDRVPAVNQNFILRVLTPNHTGLTTKSQPTLYWFISKPVSAQFALTLEENTAPDSYDYIEPLIDIVLDLSVNAGIHALSLAKYNVSLEKDVEHRWTLSLVCDPYRISLNRLAGGTIKYVTPSRKLAKRIKRTRTKDLPYLYAKAGYWYDALESMSEQIKNNISLRKTRADLLQQVGLSKVADFER